MPLPTVFAFPQLHTNQPLADCIEALDPFASVRLGQASRDNSRLYSTFALNVEYWFSQVFVEAVQLARCLDCGRLDCGVVQDLGAAQDEVL